MRVTSITNTSKALVFLALVALILFANNNYVSLWDQDESAYAGFALNMVETGDWLMPDFTWSDVHRKPPLHFWNIAISYKIFGVNEFAVRFPSVLFVILTLSLVFWGGRKIFGERQSLFGMAVLATSFLVPSLAKISVTDATLLFFTTLCALAMLHILLFRKWVWVIVFWVSLSLALLTKGPPVILFAGGFGLLLLVFHPKRKNLLILHPWVFLPFSMLPLLAWAYACMQYPQGKIFIEWMLDWYILKRIGGSVFGQTGPPGTHLLGIVLFFLPYLFLIPSALIKMARTFLTSEKGNSFLLAAWFVAGWFIFELSPSKLPAYVVAAHVPLALIIGGQLAENKIPGNWLKGLQIFVWICIGSGLTAAPFLLDLPLKSKLVFLFAAASMAVGLFLTFRNKAKQNAFPTKIIALSLWFQAIVWIAIMPTIEPLKNSTLIVAKTAGEMAERETKVVLANKFSMPPSLPFYLRLRFDNIVEEYDINKLLVFHESEERVLFILNQEQKEHFENSMGQIYFREIQASFTDRLETGTYYLFVKP